MGINRIKLQAGSPLEMAAAQKAKTLDPALDAVRQQLFGQDYIQDIGRQKGIAQYYSGFGIPSSLQFTSPRDLVDASTANVVDTISGGGDEGGGPEFVMPSEGRDTFFDSRTPEMLEQAGGTAPGGQFQTDYFPTAMDVGYGEGQVDPRLAEAAAGGAENLIDTTPISNLIDGSISVENIPFVRNPGNLRSAQTIYNQATNLIGQGKGDQIIQTGNIRKPAMTINELQKMANNQIQDARMQYNVDTKMLDRTTIEDLPYSPVRTVKDAQGNIYDYATGNLIQTADTPPEAVSAFEQVKSGLLSANNFIKDFGQNIFNKLSNLTRFSPTFSLLRQLEPASGMQQKLVADQFADEGVQFDDIGRIIQAGDYDTPENVMAGYTPGPTGLRIGDFSIGGNIIQESIVDRLSQLEKTKNEKYGGSFYNADGTPKNNPDTGEPTKLGQREEALRENLNMVARAAGATTLDGGQTTYATDVFPDFPDFPDPVEKTLPLTGYENIIIPPEKPKQPSRQQRAEEIFGDIQTINLPFGQTGYINTDDPSEVFSSAAEAVEAKEAADAAAEQAQIQAEGREAFRIAQQREADQAFAERVAREREEAAARRREEAAAADRRLDDDRGDTSAPTNVGNPFGYR